LCGQTVLLLAERALYWKEAKMLVVADPHFGKGQVFRASGIPVPRGTTDDDLSRLSRLMDGLRPRRLLFLGDLIHGCMDTDIAFGPRGDRWRQSYGEVQMFLITGNHDRNAGQPPHQFRFEKIAARRTVAPFVFTHQPTADHSGYGIAGHLHPAVTIRGKGRQKETLPCFCIGDRQALLPAFGGFTGTQVIRPSAEDRVYVIAGDEVIDIC
jgi:DNA ligase-associated metallophosphoesterase